jgi:hypothetical protein
MCIWATSSFPLPLPLGRTCPARVFSDFVDEKNIKDNKKNMAFF